MVAPQLALAADELEFIIKDSGAETMIYGSSFTALSVICSLGRQDRCGPLDRSRRCRERPSFAQHYDAVRDSASVSEPTLGAIGDDLLFIMYTSGTTGLPKGVACCHRFWAILTFGEL